MRRKSMKIVPGTPLYLVEQDANSLPAPYIASAVVGAKDEASAIEQLVAFASGMKWAWGCAGQMEDVAIEADLLEAIEIGTTTAKGLKYDHGVVTFRIGVNPRVIDGRSDYRFAMEFEDE